MINGNQVKALEWTLLLRLKSIFIVEWLMDPSISIVVPFTSEQSIKSFSPPLKSWRGLENRSFVFSHPESKNFGGIYYNYRDPSGFECEYDNIVELHSIKFGKISAPFIEAEIELKINFEDFNVGLCPVVKDFKCPKFNLKTHLLIGDLRFSNARISTQNFEDLESIAAEVITVADYHPCLKQHWVNQGINTGWEKVRTLFFTPDFYAKSRN